MKKILKFLSTIALIFMVLFTATSAAAFIVQQGGTGVSTISGLIKGNGTSPFSAATSGTDYEVPLTFSTGLTRSSNTVTVNTSQNISTLSNLTSNGLIKTSGGTGALSVATAGTDYQAPVSLTTTGTSGAATFISNTLNIPNYNGTPSPLTTKGDVYTFSTANARLGVGTDGKVLTADSSAATGLSWQTGTSQWTNITGGIAYTAGLVNITGSGISHALSLGDIAGGHFLQCGYDIFGGEVGCQFEGGTSNGNFISYTGGGTDAISIGGIEPTSASVNVNMSTGELSVGGFKDDGNIFSVSGGSSLFTGGEIFFNPGSGDGVEIAEFGTEDGLFSNNGDQTVATVDLPNGLYEYANKKVVWDDTNGQLRIDPDGTTTPLDGASGTPDNPVIVAQTTNNYSAINSYNRSSGDTASADVIAANDADDGTISGGHFIDMGLNSSGYDPSVNGLYSGGPNAGYLMVNGGSLNLTTQKTFAIQFRAGCYTNPTCLSAQFDPSSSKLEVGVDGVSGNSGILELGRSAGDGGNHVDITTQSGTTNWIMQAPPNAGNNKDVLQTDGTGITSWVPQSGSGGSSLTIGTTTVASGTSGRVLYDNAGTLGEMTNTGTGTVNVLQTSPTLITPVLGVATATSINKVTITAPTTSATLTLVDGSSLITSGAFATTLTATATTNVTLPTTGTLATRAGTETFTNKDLTSGTNTFPTFNQNTTGSAATLTTGRTIAITGDLTYTSPSFNGSSNVTAAGTLATVNSNVGSFGSATQTGTFTVNGKGLITAASNTTITPAVGSITGLGSGVATWLATPSSTNLASAITDETGSGALVFGTSPTITLASASTAITQTANDNSTKVATTAYVDNAVVGQDFKEAVKYATTGALASIIYSNGTSGVGATLTGVSVGALSVDGSSPSIGDRILVKNQASTFQNGIYSVTATGSGIAVFVLTRTTDFDQAADIKTGDAVFVTAGTAGATTTWAYTGGDTPVMGTNPITFAQIAGQGALTLTTTGSSGAATLTGNTLNIPIYSGGTSYTFSTGLTNTSGTITDNLATGSSGGQSVIGDTASGGNLTLSSTSNATKGKILFGNSFYNEATGAMQLGAMAPLAGARLTISSDTAGAGSVEAYSFGASVSGDASFYAASARGTQAAPTATQSGDRIGGLYMGGYGTSFNTTGSVESYATQNFTGSNKGTKLQLFVTANGSTTRSSALTIDQDSTVLINNLAGSGTRMVVASSTGLLSTQTIPAGGSLTVGTSTITSGTNTKVLFDNSGVLGEYTVTGTTNVVMSTSPSITTPLIFASGQTTNQTAVSGSSGQFVGLDANPLRITFDTHNNASASGTALMFRRSRGTAASPSAVSANDVLASFNARGYGTSQYAAASTGVLSFMADEAFTNTANGTYLSISTTPDGSVTAGEVARFTSDRLRLGVAGTMLGKLDFAGNTSGNITVQGVAAAGTSVNTLQAVTDTFVYRNSSDTLTNKTLTNPVINVGSDATGDIYYRSSGILTRLAIGGANTVLHGGTIPSYSAIVPGDESYAAQTFNANNTGSTTAPTAQTYKDSGKLTYTGTITWTGTTPPSGTTNHTYWWTQVGKMVTYHIELNYATASTGTTMVTFDLPTDMPTPDVAGGLSGASNFIFKTNGSLITNASTAPNVISAGLRRDSGNTKYEFNVTTSSGTHRIAIVEGSYWTP